MSLDTVLVETIEDVNKHDKTKTDSVASNPERSEFETKGEIKDSAVLAHPSLPAPPTRPLTPPPQLPQNRSVSGQPETIDETKRSPLTKETKWCTVRLEILTEADIVKHVHVHQETVPHAKAPPTVEASKATPFTRSRAKPKPGRTNRHPRSANQHVNYTNLEPKPYSKM